MANAVRRGNPERIVVSNCNMEDHFAYESLITGKLNEMAVAKSKEPASPRSNPKVVVPVLRQRPNARVCKTILFSIDLESIPIENRQSAVSDGNRFKVYREKDGLANSC